MGLRPNGRLPVGRPASSRLTMVAIVAVALALFTCVIQALGKNDGGCGTSDVARGRPVTASSTKKPEFAASAAADGDGHSRWASTWSDPQWLQVDLGRRIAICGVVLDWADAYATAFEVQTSDDASKWTSLYSTTTGRGGRQVVPVAGDGRYLRVYLRASTTPDGYSVWELQVHSGRRTTGPSEDNATARTVATEQILSYHKPTEASSARNDDGCKHCAPARAVDLDPATRWATADPSGSPGWIFIDLGAMANVSLVVLEWGDAYARSYDIQVSPDTVTWTTVYRTATGHGLLETIPARGVGRYVRMYATGSATTDGYSLWEFTVYGTGGAPLAPPSGPAAPKDPLRLVWSDDFDGPASSPPDPAKWRPDIGPGFTGELEYNTDNKNAFRDGSGHLVMEARREVTPGTTCPADPISGSTTCQYTSARLTTSGRLSFTYGRVEARIQVSGTQGLWPAFWMLGANLYTGQAAWPNCGEIDVMEHVGRSPSEISSTLHAPAYYSKNGIGAAYQLDGDFSSGFHVYAVDWRPGRITFSVDGHPFFTVDKATVEKTRGPWVFDHPFILLLDNAVGGPFPGQPDERTVLPQRMLVDYVRVYR